jgi:hypothetical protein
VTISYLTTTYARIISNITVYTFGVVLSALEGLIRYKGLLYVPLHKQDATESYLDFCILDPHATIPRTHKFSSAVQRRSRLIDAV